MLRCLAISIVFTAACSHDTAVGGYHATFHGGQLNAPPTKTDRFTVDGVKFVVEHSNFIYELGDPFQSWELLASVTLDDSTRTWHPTVEDRRQFADGWYQGIQQRLDVGAPGRAVPPQCDAPRLEHDAWLIECTATRDQARLQLRARVLEGPRGVVIQEASWVSDKGHEWTDAFWSSLHQVNAAATPSSPPVTVRVDRVVALTSQLAFGS